MNLTRVTEDILNALRIGLLESNGDIPVPVMLGADDIASFDPSEWLAKNIHFCPFDATRRTAIGLELHLYWDSVDCETDHKFNHSTYTIETVIPETLEKLR